MLCLTVAVDLDVITTARHTSSRKLSLYLWSKTGYSFYRRVYFAGGQNLKSAFRHSLRKRHACKRKIWIRIPLLDEVDFVLHDGPWRCAPWCSPALITKRHAGSIPGACADGDESLTVGYYRTISSAIRYLRFQALLLTSVLRWSSDFGVHPK